MPPLRNQNRFRLQGRSLFLTYPQCNLSIPFVLNYLWNLFTRYTPTYIRVAQEAHQDGEPHLHVLLQTSDRFNLRSPGFCDIMDPNNATRTDLTCAEFHPNLQVPRSDAAVHDYISKGGVFEERGTLKANRKSPRKKRDTVWSKILQESTSKSDFLTRVASEQPFTYATQLRNLEYMADKRWPTPPTLFVPKWTTFIAVPQELQNWAESNLLIVRQQWAAHYDIDTRMDLHLEHQSNLELLQEFYLDTVLSESEPSTIDLAGTRSTAGASTSTNLGGAQQNGEDYVGPPLGTP